MKIRDLYQAGLDYARLERDLKPQIDSLKTEKNRAASALQEAEDTLKQGKVALQQAGLNYVRETGDIEGLPDFMTFRRSTDLMYDRDEMTAWMVSKSLVKDSYSAAEVQHLLLSGLLGEYLTVDVKLDVRKFEADYRNDLESVPAPQIAIGRLGGLLIEAGEV